MKDFLGMTAQNDNTPTLEKTDITEVIAEILCNGNKLLKFTTYLKDKKIISLEEKNFIDEIFGDFGSFDAPRKLYTSLDCRRLYHSLTNKLSEPLISEEYPFLSDKGFPESFIAMLQADIATYLQATDQSGEISKVVGDMRESAGDIIQERRK